MVVAESDPSSIQHYIQEGRMKRLHYSTRIKRQMTGRARRVRRPIDWNSVGCSIAVTLMMFGFLAAVAVRILL